MPNQAAFVPCSKVHSNDNWAFWAFRPRYSHDAWTQHEDSKKRAQIKSPREYSAPTKVQSLGDRGNSILPSMDAIERRRGTGRSVEEDGSECGRGIRPVTPDTRLRRPDSYQSAWPALPYAPGTAAWNTLLSYTTVVGAREAAARRIRVNEK